MKKALLLGTLLCLLPATAMAGPLGDYKKQKHEKRERVTTESCPDAYKKDCKSKCNAGDEACYAKCDSTAAEFCEKREERRTEKQVEIAAKAATLAVGMAAVLIENALGDPPTGVTTPYTIFFDQASLTLDLGGGWIYGGAYATAVDASFRLKYFGVGAHFTYLWDKTDYLVEGDFGPSFNLASGHFLATLQPSLVVSDGNDVDGVKVDTLYGFGLRAPLLWVLGEAPYVIFDPMLYYMNQQWGYRLRIGLGLRITPNIGISGTYEYRDITDLNDLDISQASLQGGFAYLSIRFN